MTHSEFKRLAVEWHRETAYMSSVSDICAHPAYRRIVAMGSPVVPWILVELEHGEGNWCCALKEITGADPVLPEDRGRVQAMADAWIAWGRDW